RLAHHAERPSAFEAEGNPVDGPHHAPRGAEVRREVGHLEEGPGRLGGRRVAGRALALAAGSHRPPSLISKNERSRSPAKFRASTVKNSAIEGQRQISGSCSRELRPSLIIPPHVGVGGRTDRPRKASAPSATMATATATSANDRAVGSTLGRISRRTMRVLLAPRARAASTNSRWA